MLQTIYIILGVILIIDGVVSILLVSQDRVTSNFGIDSKDVVFIGHIFRILSIVIGIFLIYVGLTQMNFDNIFKILGIYLILDGLSSIITSSGFEKIDDWFIRLGNAALRQCWRS